MIWRKCIILRIISQKGGIDVEHAYSLKKIFFESLLESLVRLIGRSLSLPKPDTREEVPSSDAQTPTHSYKKHEESVNYNPSKGGGGGNQGLSTLKKWRPINYLTKNSK